jgi:hypothetical protein
MKMPKYKLHGTMYTYMDAIVEAKDEEEAIALADADKVEWYEVGGDWESITRIWHSRRQMMIKHICQHCKNIMHIPKEWLLYAHKLVCYVCSNEIKREEKQDDT